MLRQATAQDQALAWTLFSQINFSSPSLFSWQTAMHIGVKTSNHPIPLARAFITFCDYLETCPPYKITTPEGRIILNILVNTNAHTNPESYIDAYLFIKKSGIPLSHSFNKNLSHALKQHLNPLILATAIVSIYNTELFSDSCPNAINNLNQLSNVAELWFDDLDLATQLANIPKHDFTQALFDALIEAGEKNSSIDEQRLHLSMRISDHTMQTYDPILNDSKKTQAPSVIRPFCFFYPPVEHHQIKSNQFEKRILTSINKDKRQRSASEDHKTHSEVVATQRRQSTG